MGCLHAENEEKYTMPTLLAILVIIMIVALWVISEQRKLVVLDENINNAMNQIGVQLSCQFDALTALLDLARSFDRHECETLSISVQSGRSVITAKSTPEDVLRQEGIISEALNRIIRVTELYPELKVDPMYIRTMDALQVYEIMVRNSCLIYNDSVAKLSREARKFPGSMLAGILGLQKREYLCGSGESVTR